MPHGNDRYSRIEEQLIDLKIELNKLRSEIEHLSNNYQSLLFRLEHNDINISDILKEL